MVNIGKIGRIMGKPKKKGKKIEKAKIVREML